MKTIAAIFVLSCLSLCLAKSIVNISGDGQPTTWWGDISGVDVDFTETETVYAAAKPNTAHFHILPYPKEKPSKNLQIVGVKYFDHADHPVDVIFIETSLPQPKVHFMLQSQLGHGINSTFIFYGRYLS